MGEYATRTLEICVPLPPSDNHVYKNIPKKGRVLTKEAKEYKTTVKQMVARKAAEYGLLLNTSEPHIIVLTIYYEKDSIVSKQPWRPFKKNDASNRTKILIDAVTDGAGIDDGCLFYYLIEKKIAFDGITKVEVFLSVFTEKHQELLQSFSEQLKEAGDGPAVRIPITNPCADG